MKTTALITTAFCVFIFLTDSTSARDYSRANQFGLTWPWRNRLHDDVNQLNRMRGHVRWQLHNYRADPQVRRDFWRISRDIDGINARVRQGGFNRRELRRDIDRARFELHQIEMALRVRPRDFYPWR